jgi:hypothetical protein
MAQVECTILFFNLRLRYRAEAVHHRPLAEEFAGAPCYFLTGKVIVN